MSQVSEKVNKVLLKEKKYSKDLERINELHHVIEDLQKRGVIKNQGYTIPLVDTIGRNYYSSQKKSNL